MKRLSNIFLAAAVILLGMSSCQKESQNAEPVGKKENVTIAIQSPDMLTTKTIGDGAKAKAVYYTAFVGDLQIQDLKGKLELIDGNATLNVPLVKNVHYDFVFWAQYEAEGVASPYDISTFYEDAKVTVSYDGPANDDYRDAFCAKKDIYVGMTDNVVTLSRPFAQVNFAAADYEMVKYLDLHQGMTSETTVLGLPDVLNVRYGTVSVSDASAGITAKFTPAAIPSDDDEYITIAGEDYGYVNMNYVLASEVGETVKVQAKFVNGTSKWETKMVDNVPVCRNHKTNIFGNIFSEDATLHIVVDPLFKKPDTNKEL